jgi:hypothetical protein
MFGPAAGFFFGHGMKQRAVTEGGPYSAERRLGSSVVDAKSSWWQRWHAGDGALSRKDVEMFVNAARDGLVMHAARGEPQRFAAVLRDWAFRLGCGVLESGRLHDP